MSEMDPNNNEKPSLSPEELNEFHRLSVILTALAVALLIASVYGYSTYGGSWVDSLDEHIGEVHANRARGLVKAEFKDEAVITFKQALSVRFDDPMQRVWVSHDLGKLLIELGRHEEAIEVSKACVDLKGESGEAYSIWHKALKELHREEEALEQTRVWFTWGSKRNLTNSMAWAKFYEGTQLRKAGDDRAALEAFQEGVRIHPEGNIGNLLATAAAQLVPAKGQ